VREKRRSAVIRAATLNGMRLTLVRLLLSPVTSSRAAWAMARSRGQLSFDAAWRRERLARHPDELVYRLHGHLPPHGQEAGPDAGSVSENPGAEPDRGYEK